MADERELLRHFLAVLAYRTQKAVKNAPLTYPGSSLGASIRSPVEILRHMTELMGNSAAKLAGTAWSPLPESPDFEEEVRRFHEQLEFLSGQLAEVELEAESARRLLQGPLADAMTHVGQLAMLRRIAGSALPAENFYRADIDADNVSANQPLVEPNDDD